MPHTSRQWNRRSRIWRTTGIRITRAEMQRKMPATLSLFITHPWVEVTRAASLTTVAPAAKCGSVVEHPVADRRIVVEQGIAGPVGRDGELEMHGDGVVRRVATIAPAPGAPRRLRYLGDVLRRQVLEALRIRAVRVVILAKRLHDELAATLRLLEVALVAVRVRVDADTEADRSRCHDDLRPGKLLDHDPDNPYRCAFRFFPPSSSSRCHEI